jgi:hypothetical protein
MTTIADTINNAEELKNAVGTSRDHIDNPNFGRDDAQDPDFNDKEAEYRRDTDAGVAALNGKAETPQARSGSNFQRPPKTPAELKQEAEQIRGAFALMTTPGATEQHEAIEGALYTLFNTVANVTSSERASFLLGDLAFSAQRSFVSANRWIERGMEWMERIATSNYSNAEEQMERAQESFQRNVDQLNSAALLLNSLLTVWAEVANPDAAPVLRDWLVIVRSVENAEQNQQSTRKEVKDAHMKAALDSNVAMLAAIGIAPKKQQ